MSLNTCTLFFEQMMETVDTVVPATFVSRQGHLITARPTIGLMMENGQKILCGDLMDIPLVSIGSNGFEFEIELKEGDPLLILVLSADSRKWQYAAEWKEQVHAASPVRHNKNSSVAIPVCWAQGKTENRISISADGTMTVVNEAGAKVVLDKSGKVGVSNSTTSAKDLLNDAWAEMNGLAADLVASFNALATVANTGPGALTIKDLTTPLGLACSVSSATLTARITAITAKMAKVEQLLQ